MLIIKKSLFILVLSIIIFFHLYDIIVRYKKNYSINVFVEGNYSSMLFKISDLEIYKKNNNLDIMNINKKFQWGNEKYPMPTKPVYWSYIGNEVTAINYYVVLDDKNQLWFDNDNQFQNSSAYFKNSNIKWEPIYQTLWTPENKSEIYDGFMIPFDFDRNNDVNNTIGPLSINNFVVLEDIKSQEKTSNINRQKLPLFNVYFARVVRKNINNNSIIFKSNIDIELIKVEKKVRKF